MRLRARAHGVHADGLRPRATRPRDNRRLDHLACVAPSADAAGARVEVAVDFGDAAAVGARATMWGDAALLDGALRLSAIGPESHGALVLRAAAALPPLAEFEVRFDVVLRSEAPPTNEEAIWASFLNPIDQIPVDWDTVDLDDGRVVRAGD